MRIIFLLLMGITAVFAADKPAEDVLKNTIVAQKTITSEEFSRKAVQGGMLEIEAGKIALSKSRDGNVKAFAQRMITDHGGANAELQNIVGTRYSLPTQLDAENQAKFEALSIKSGADFDNAYGKAMMQDHQDAIGLFTEASTASTVSPALQQFARKTLPTLQEHHRLSMTLPSAPSK